MPSPQSSFPVLWKLISIKGRVHWHGCVPDANPSRPLMEGRGVGPFGSRLSLEPLNLTRSEAYLWSGLFVVI
jgi:hypothetical protein